MNYLDELTEELRIYAQELVNGEINREEFQLKLDLVIRKVEQIEINFDATRLSLQSGIFNQLLFQRKYKALTALRELKQIDNRRRFNAKIREILADKLYFRSLHYSLKNSIDKYQIRDSKKPVDPQIFIPGDDQE